MSIFRTARPQPYESSLTRAAEAALEKRGRRRILFVDDDPRYQEIMRITAEDFNVELTVAGSCAEAREILREGSEFDAVILDVRLTNGSGVQLYRDIAARRPRWQVVFLTGYATEDIRAQVEEIGPARIYEKSSCARPDFIAQFYLQLGAKRV